MNAVHLHEPDLTVAEIAQRLVPHAVEVAHELLPQGHREGHEWRCGSVRGEPGSSLGVHLTGTKAGVWRDFAAEDGGDLIDLIEAVLVSTKGEAVGWAKRFLGVEQGERERPRPVPAPPAEQADPDAAIKQARALDIWRKAREDVNGTPAETYLRSRDLDPARLCSLHGRGRWPATLRYSERAAFDPDCVCRALVVAVHGAECGLVRAIQRIMLNPDGSAQRDNKGRRRKLCLGPIRGNAAMGDYSPDPGGHWGLAEGVETALASYALTGIRTWAAIAAGNMEHVKPPSWAGHVTIFADHDAAGIAGAVKTMRRLQDCPNISTVRILGAAVTCAFRSIVITDSGGR